MTPKDLTNRVLGICMDCGKPTGRHRTAYYCFPCQKDRNRVNQQASGKKAYAKKKSRGNK